MPRWLRSALTRIHELARQHRVYLTEKAVLNSESSASVWTGTIAVRSSEV